MASSMSRANAVAIFVDYYTKLNGPMPTKHDPLVDPILRSTLANVLALLTTTNTDGGYTIALAEPRVTITPYSSGTRPYKVKSGQAISYTIATTGGETTSTPVAFTAIGLPYWLTLNAATGALTGTAPAVTSTYVSSTTGGEVAKTSDLYPVAMISAKNAFAESVNGPYPFTFQVTNASASNITSAATGTGVHAGALAAYTITADNTPTSFVAYDLAQLNAGATPGTVALNPLTGVISGNLGAGTGSPAAGTYTIYVAAVNAFGEGVDKAVVITLS